MYRVLAFFILVFCIAPAHAAPGFPPEIPLEAPIIAVETVAQDAIILLSIGDNGETRAIRRLQFGDGAHRIWGFSPDGCALLFTLGEPLNGIAPSRAYRADLDGSNVRALVNTPLDAGGRALLSDAWGVWEPTWSPAGDRIAFTLIQRDDAMTLTGGWEHRTAWVAPPNLAVPDSADGTRAGGDAAFYSITGDEHTPRWSPDGARLAYVSYESDLETRAREAELWTVAADGTDKQRLTDYPAGSVAMPRWSPDGTLIGFVYSPAPNDDQFWMIGAAAGAIPTQLSYGASLALDLAWLPDGTAMIAAARDVRGTAENRLWRIPLVGSLDADGGEYAPAGVPLDPMLSHADYPRFSADGRWLALRSAYRLALVDTVSGVWRWVEDSPLSNTPVWWSPVGFEGEGQCGS